MAGISPERVSEAIRELSRDAGAVSLELADVGANMDPISDAAVSQSAAPPPASSSSPRRRPCRSSSATATGVAGATVYVDS